MTLTPEEAREKFDAEVAKIYPWSHVTKLLEDDTDYCAETENHSEPGPIMVGPGFMFVSKATGDVWHGWVPDMFYKLDAMTEVVSE